MDWLPDIATLSVWLIEHRIFLLFALLALTIIALPIPGETLLLLVGFFIYQGKVCLAESIVVACVGTMFGMSVSYLLGRSAGLFLVTKYGKWVGITEKHLAKAHNWSARFGKWSLFFGYFIPGVRHFTGLLAGTTKLHFTQFAPFAYGGAIFWVSLFIAIGYCLAFLGFSIEEEVESILYAVLFIVLTLLAVAMISYGYARWRKKRIKRPVKVKP